MVARLLYLAMVLGLSNLGSLGLPTISVAQAATGGGFVLATPTKRPLFRPWSYSHEPRATTAPRGGVRGFRGVTRSGDAVTPRARAQATPGAASRRAMDAMIFDPRAGARKAVPITRGQELGLRFRPDENASPYAQPGQASGRPTQPFGPVEAELQSQFRPVTPRRKPTYEELQAESAPVRPRMHAPAMPYPALPAPLPPGLGGGWPAW